MSHRASEGGAARRLPDSQPPSPRETNGASARAEARLLGGSTARSRRAVVTGGAGFVGTNMVVRLLEEGYDVTLLDNLSRPGVARNLEWLREAYPRQIQLIQADIRDAGAVCDSLRDADVVFHFAAQVAVTSSLEEPRYDFDVNAAGTLNVLEACRQRSSPPALLFTSTNKVYGNLGGVKLTRGSHQYAPVDEAMCRYGVSESQPLDFHSPYGCSKGVADQYVLDYARCYDLPALVFRMSCIYGPHQCGNVDQGWVAHFTRQVLAGQPITLFGDGYQVRDLLYVDDLTDAMLRAVRSIDDTAGHAFNIGGGPGNKASVREVVEVLATLHGSAPEASNSAWRQGDQRYYVSDTRKFADCVGWRPSTSVSDGIRGLYEWTRDSRTRRRPAMTPSIN